MIMSIYFHPVLSHTRTVVRECFKGDEASQWKRPDFDPSPHQNPLTDLHQNWQAWLRPGQHSARKTFVAIGSGDTVPQIRDFAVILGWLVCSFFGGSSIRLQPTPLCVYLRKIRQMTSFRARKCLLWVHMTIFYIWTLKFPKNRHFGDRFWLDFFCDRKPL